MAINQLMKPLLKICEETNQLIKDMLKQVSNQTLLLGELSDVPRELQKAAQQLSHVVHMVCEELLLYYFALFFLLF